MPHIDESFHLLVHRCKQAGLLSDRLCGDGYSVVGQERKKSDALLRNLDDLRTWAQEFVFAHLQQAGRSDLSQDEARALLEASEHLDEAELGSLDNHFKASVRTVLAEVLEDSGLDVGEILTRRDHEPESEQVQGDKSTGNIITDHCSISWGIDENLSVYGPYDNVTVQWCITSEALCDSIHPKGPHGMGMIVGTAAQTRVSVHHCLFAHNLGRTPLIATRREAAPVIDLRNNVAYARFQPCIQILGHPNVNVVGCAIKRGAPADRPLKRWFGISPTNPYTQYGPAEIYVKDNRWPANPKGAADAWTIVAHPDRPPPPGFRLARDVE